ncbi:hypothetical protein EDD18DRAFT_1105693 [Armillaria luteobubalina]|uniref:Uncharacterized protein n=1 Tax=Armillaria luteobubalina TaxID=153913 RepID=A0AA39UNH4_9AGAR|nr:hypothetical protein EDD18DRAFT_1105693 [Armillaria luteobubalina]
MMELEVDSGGCAIFQVLVSYTGPVYLTSAYYAHCDTFLALPSDFMMSSSSAPVQVTCVEGNIYSTASPYSHAHPLPEWPQRSQNLNPNTAKYEDMNQFCWVSNDLLHMMLVSTWKPFYGPLFERLSLPDYTIPTQSVFEEAKGAWVLKDRVRVDWITLEWQLQVILSACLHFSTAPLPKFWQPWSYPQCFGHLFWNLSYEMAEREVSSFEWRKQLLEKAKPIVHASWLALLEDSVIFDNEVCRVGGIIDYATCKFLPFLPDLIYMFPSMPLYINWGPDRPLIVLSYLPVPHYHDFKAPLPLDAATAIPTPECDSSLPVKIIRWDFPPVEKYSGQRAGQKNYHWHWGQFGAKQHRYNSFHNEWDLCEELDPQDEPTHIYMSDDDNSDYDGEDHYFPLDNDNDEVPDQDEGLYSSSADLECVHGIELIHQTEPKDFSVPVERPQDALDDVMYCHFGFTAPIVAVPKPSTVPEMHHVHKFVGVLQDTGVSHKTQEAMTNFFGYLLQAGNILDIPHELYDLRQHDADVHSLAAIHIQKKVLNGHLYYILSDWQADTSPTFTILLTSVASVVEIRLETSFVAPCYSLLGCHPTNYKPNRLEFATYQALCKGFLRSQQGHAALLAGGILGCIAQDFISNDEVYLGPSADVLKSGICFVTDGESTPIFLDNALTDNEIDLLCSIYKVETGCRNGNEPQCSFMSWFPKPAAWEISGFNISFWSFDCESWYQGCLNEINCPDPVLQMTNQWRHSLWFLKQSQKVAQVNECLAAEYLQSIGTFSPS